MAGVSRTLQMAGVALAAMAFAHAAMAESSTQKTNFSSQFQAQGEQKPGKKQAQQQQQLRARQQQQQAAQPFGQSTWFGQPTYRQAPPQAPWFNRNGYAQQQQQPRQPFFFGLFGGRPVDQQGQRPAQPDVADSAPVVEEVEGAEIYDYKPPALVPVSDPKLAAPVSPRFDDTVALSIWQRLKEGSTGVQATADQRNAILSFYAGRDFRPLWADPEAAKSLQSVLASAAAEGLDPDDYRVPAVTGKDPSDLARHDIQLTAAALRYAQHASGGRIVPNNISGYQDRTPPTVKASTALARLASNDTESYLASLQPTHPAYAAMKKELAHYLTKQTETADTTIDDGPKIRVGSDDARVPLIRKRLKELADAGDLPDIDPADLGENVQVSPVDGEGNIPATNAVDKPNAETIFTQADAAAVRAFQASAGLDADGIVGVATVAKLNGGPASGADRRQVLIDNMERLRWLPRDLGKRYVFVNQASFSLQVIENGEEVWGTRVIVGKPNTQTVEFSDQMETVEFNPYWGVPPSIIAHEMRPRLLRDPSYLDRNGFEVVDSRGRVVSSSDVNWSAYGKNPPFGVRQPPGSDNALGEVKFLFPNEHHIYMHDTPTKALFAKSMRAFSHGCVRVQNPRQFAEVVLGWSADEVDAAIAAGENRAVKLDRPLPVHLTYFTAWPDENGKIRYFADVYGRDALLETALGKSQLAMR
ncbi:MAG: L,D-transpeptidase family protein [Hyphomicrobiales bacterium]